jgi:hypothetical protein
MKVVEIIINNNSVDLTTKRDGEFVSININEQFLPWGDQIKIVFE